MSSVIAIVLIVLGFLLAVTLKLIPFRGRSILVLTISSVAFIAFLVSALLKPESARFSLFFSLLALILAVREIRARRHNPLAE